MDKEYDVIIIGGGAAGLAAAIYTSRRTLKTLVISKDLGGQASLATTIENYPGRETVSGFELMNDFKKQAEKFGAEIIFEEVEKIEDLRGKFLIKSFHHQYISQAVILAFGLTPCDLKVPGEQEFKGKGVSYCATCDAPFFKNKIVAVVGGGNCALDAAELLSKNATKIFIINRENNLRGEEILEKRVREKDNIKIFFNTEVVEIKGDKTVTAIMIKNNQNQETKELTCQGVFVEIGYIAKTKIVKELVELNEKNQIKISRDCETSHPGIFAAGDVTDVTYKQVVISAGEGVKAALQTYKYLQQQKSEVQKSKAKIEIDWGKK